MKGLLILPKKKLYADEEEGGGYEGDEGMDEKDSDDSDDDFSELFGSFVSALGVEPKNLGKAEKRFKALLSVMCDKYMK